MKGFEEPGAVVSRYPQEFLAELSSLQEVATLLPAGSRVRAVSKHADIYKFFLKIRLAMFDTTSSWKITMARVTKLGD